MMPLTRRSIAPLRTSAITPDAGCMSQPCGSIGSAWISSAIDARNGCDIRSSMEKERTRTRLASTSGGEKSISMPVRDSLMARLSCAR
jgi:hypothetical protein